MATKKRPSGQRLKEIRHGLSILHKQGLWKGDARKAKGGWRQVKLLHTYSDVVHGKAKAVKTSKTFARNAPDSLRAKGDRVVIRTKTDKETFRFDPKTNQIKGTRERYGGKYNVIIAPQKVMSLEDLPKAEKGQKFHYSITMKGWQVSPSFEDPQELYNFITGHGSGGRTYAEKLGAEWLQYVEIESVAKNAPKPKKARDKKGRFR